MTQFVVTRHEDGKLGGFGLKGARAWIRFVMAMRGLAIGETMVLIFWIPRSIKFHRRHFALLAQVFDGQEQFHDPDQFRLWVQVGAGHCDIVPGPMGKPVALPKSIAFHKLDDLEFAEVHESCVLFLRTRHAHRFLWPHMSDLGGSEMMECILAEFDR